MSSELNQPPSPPYYSSPEQCTWERNRTSGATHWAQQTAPHTSHLQAHLFSISPSDHLLTSPAQTFTLFNRDETLDTITAFQGRHAHIVCSNITHFLSAVCPFSLLPSHYPAVSTLPTTLLLIPSSPSLVTPPPQHHHNHHTLPQTPPLLSDTQRGRSPSLSVPAGKHMLLFPSDSGVFERGGIV